MKKFSFVIVAGGSGSRMGGERKQFRLLGGRPMWRWSAEMAASMAEEGIGEIVLVLPKGEVTPPPWRQSARIPLRLAGGGASRAESVLNGLNAASFDYVMVHDAARPFISVSLMRRLMEETSEGVGAVPVLPASDAIKRIDGERVEAVERDGLYMTQTPQSFYRPTLMTALRDRGSAVKDEAEAWLASGLELHCVEGERLNFKVTWPDDLHIAERIAEGRRAPTVRTGLGYDVHRLVPERPLVLGGVLIEDSPLGLLGHSDADLLAHTVADAILGAAGLPDIGTLFPASSEEYRDADSMELLKTAVDLVVEAGWTIAWVDAVVQAQVPRLGPHLAEMRKRLSAILNPDLPNCVSLKAKSAEGTGDPGLGGSMTCWASATLYGDGTR